MIQKRQEGLDAFRVALKKKIMIWDRQQTPTVVSNTFEQTGFKRLCQQTEFERVNTSKIKTELCRFASLGKHLDNGSVKIMVCIHYFDNNNI